MYIVSNTTPIISLLKLNELDLLQSMFGEISIPEAVYNEITVKGSYNDEIEIFKKAGFINKKVVRNELAVKLMKKQVGLDSGESEAIVLTDELKDAILIIDELKGRKVAIDMGLKVTGTLGIILKSKERGIITAVKPLLDALIDNNIRIGSKLYEDILKKAGEK